MNESTPLKLAVIGAGPVGLALALHAARALPERARSRCSTRARSTRTSAAIRARSRSRSAACSCCSASARGAPSSAQPIARGARVAGCRRRSLGALASRLGRAGAAIRAIDEAVPMLGAVLSYGAHRGAAAGGLARGAGAREPARLADRFGSAVAALKNVAAPARRRGRRMPASPSASTSRSSPRAACSRRARAISSPARIGRRCATTTARPRGSGIVTFAGGDAAAPAASPSSASRATARPRCCRCATARAALVWCVDSADDPVRARSTTRSASPC